MYRLIRGADCYWAIGRRRVARVPLAGVTPDGRLTEGQVRRLAAADLSPARDPGLYHMTVVVTTSCNLACSYCFQNTAPAPSPGRAPARIAAAAVDEDSAGDILEFGRRQMAERGASKLDLMLFGGEPTLYLRQCLRLLDGARELGLVSASMISNATRLQPAAAMALERAGLGSVQVTLDGDAPVHDRVRITIGGRGTFDQIVSNVAESSARTSLRWQLRVNLSGESLGTADALLDRLSQRLDPSRFEIGFSLVNDSGPGFEDVLRPSADLSGRVTGLYLQALEAGFGVALPRLQQCLACGVVGGGTGTVVNADGTLYSCWESVGKPGYEVGTISEGYAPDDVIRPRWVSCGYEATISPGDPDFDQFSNSVNAAILDWQYAAGVLNRVPATV